MSKFYLFIFAFSILSCQSFKVNLESCSAGALQDNAVVVEDTLGVYNITLPDSSWEIYKGDVEDWHLLVLKFVGDDYMAFNVSMTEYDHDWNWDDEQLEINNSFTVLKTGNIEQNGHSLRYNFVITDSDNFESRDLAYYLTLLDTVKRRNFTITLKTNSSRRERY